MANLQASDVVVTIVNKRRNNGTSYFTCKLAFGDGVKTYPAGGIPISKAQFGCPAVIHSLTVFDNGIGGYMWTYDKTNEKLVASQGATSAHSHPLILKNAAVADGATTRVNAGTNLLGANTGADLTVAGGGANGGVQSTTPASTPLVEPSTVAIAAQVLRCEVIGW